MADGSQDSSCDLSARQREGAGSVRAGPSGPRRRRPRRGGLDRFRTRSYERLVMSRRVRRRDFALEVRARMLAVGDCLSCGVRGQASRASEGDEVDDLTRDIAEKVVIPLRAELDIFVRRCSTLPDKWPFPLATERTQFATSPRRPRPMSCATPFRCCASVCLPAGPSRCKTRPHAARFAD